MQGRSLTIPANKEIFVAMEISQAAEVVILDASTFATIATQTFSCIAGVDSLAYDPADSQMFFAVQNCGVWVFDRLQRCDPRIRNRRRFVCL